ncbi:MAG: PKD domain-containing protein [Candidatus Cloacimonetes bacterium]|nr:PKD domain-containing protein [Candidatus Cloacimonadota bacterium]MBL7149799.1 PKD domain-containing protein [Candidatus Cloacimonadota bacterium]
MKRILWIFPIVFLILFTACGGGTEPNDNESPEINALTASDSIVSVNETIDISCEAVDPDGDELTYSWEASAGVIAGSGSNITWTAPTAPGTCGITCTVSDNEGNDSSTIEIEVVRRLKIEPAELIIAVDEEAVLSVQLYGGVDVFALSVEIVFNNGVVGVPINSVTKGDFWGDDAIMTTHIDYDRLCVAIGQVQTAGDDGITGDGTLFEFILVGLLAGESDITFENLNLIDENGDPVEGFDEMELVNGKVIVE